MIEITTGITSISAGSDPVPAEGRVRRQTGANEQLVAIVAHELRYPLIPIRNAAALLRQDSLDAATVRRAAEIIERQAIGMNRLIGDLVDVSRLQLGAIELRPARALLSELMERAVEAAAPMASERGHTLAVSVTPEPVYLNIDVLRLGQALHNIIANACKFTDKHGRIHMRAQRDGAEVEIVVSDTGIGIPRAELEAIFELFRRSVPGGRIEPGLGLGLYLARHLIDAHGGTVIAACAGPGRGCVITVRLPCELPMRLPDEQHDAEPAVDPIPA
jgi:signal transduction histidine kinase